ncbi:DMT family transporter [Hydrogenophaga sp. 5NK40-0174]|uniref:DMT family transporter n=1 Tax=Hydrogenophaga sp. 5NK40-0174 TaxID=3127649 RepID=UPI00310B53EA
MTASTTSPTHLHQPPWWAYGALGLSMSLVGSYVALSKPLLVVFPVFLLAWLRFGIGALAMARWIKRPEHEPTLERRERQLLFLQSFLGNFLFSTFMLFGVAMTSAVTAGLIMSALPGVVAILSRTFLKEQLQRQTIAAIALSAMGIGLFAYGRQEPAHADAFQAHWLGPLLVFAAVVCEASYVVIGKRLTARISPRRISAIINLWGLLLVTPMGLYAAWHFDFGTVAAPLWLLVLFYGMAASVWTVWLWMKGLQHVPAARAGVFTVMLPVSAAAIGVLLLGERPSLPQWVAFGLAMLGLWVATRKTRNPLAAPL